MLTDMLCCIFTGVESVAWAVLCLAGEAGETGRLVILLDPISSFAVTSCSTAGEACCLTACTLHLRGFSTQLCVGHWQSYK